MNSCLISPRRKPVWRKRNFRCRRTGTCRNWRERGRQVGFFAGICRNSTIFRGISAGIRRNRQSLTLVATGAV